MRKLLRRLEALLTAAAFAEEGDAETARQIAQEAEGDRRPGKEPRQPVPRPVPPAVRAARASRG